MKPGVRWAAFAGLCVIVAAVMFGPLAWPRDPAAQKIEARLSPPSVVAPFGTDQFGRDVLARVLAGGRWSLGGALLVSSGLMSLGVALGLCSVRAPRPIATAVDIATLTFQSIPGVLLALALTAVLRPSFLNLVVALIATGWPWYARVYRGLLRQAYAAQYIEGAKSLGAGNWRVIVAHVLPNIAAPALALCAVSFGSALLNLSALSFIGLGMPPPTPEWGVLISDALNFMRRAPWLALAPGLAISLTALCVNLLGTRD
jgi:peptide/nickel transport system permease protein